MMAVTLSGMVMDVRAEQRLKAEDPMEVTLFDDGHLWDGANSEQWPSGSFGEVES